MSTERSLLWLKPGLIFVVPLVIFGIVLLNRGGQSSTVLSAWLSPDVPTQINFPLGTAAQVYGFRANPGAPTRLLLNSSSPSISFTAEVRSSAGQRIAMLGGGLQNAVLTLGPGDSLYEVEFKAGGESVPGAVSLMVSEAFTETAPVSPPGVCTLSSALEEGVNIRSAPGYEYVVLAVLARGSFLVPDARSDNGWYRVNANGQAGWVLGTMVNLHGPCQNLLLTAPIPVAAAMTANAAPGYCTVSSTTNVNIRSGPGTNYTVIDTLLPGTSLSASGRSDSGWYLVAAGAEQGWVSGAVVTVDGLCDLLPRVVPAAPLPIAPYDTATFSLVTDRDGSSQVSEVISYPDGDRADLVEVHIANLYFQPPDNYREFTLTLNCTGPGVEYVRWGAPENPLHSCGSAITLPFLYDYSQQTFSITLSQLGYVQYTLVASRP